MPGLGYGMSISLFPILRCAAACLLAAPLFAQGSQSLPAGYLTAEGKASTSYPFNTLSDHIWQWHYDSSQFQVQGPIVITEVYVRTKGGDSCDHIRLPIGGDHHGFFADGLHRRWARWTSWA